MIIITIKKEKIMVVIMTNLDKTYVKRFPKILGFFF